MSSELNAALLAFPTAAAASSSSENSSNPNDSIPVAVVETTSTTTAPSIVAQEAMPPAPQSNRTDHPPLPPAPTPPTPPTPEQKQNPTLHPPLSQTQHDKADMLTSIVPSAPRDACLQALQANAWDCDQALSMIFNLDATSIKQLAATWNASLDSAAANGVSSEVPASTTTTATIDAQDTVSGMAAVASTTTPASGVIDLTNGAIVSTTTNPTSGDAVRIKQSVERPVNGWGNVKPGEVGVVIMIDADTVIVDFPSENGAPWLGHRNDVEVVTTTAGASTGASTGETTGETQGETQGETKGEDVIGGTGFETTMVVALHALVPADDGRIPQAGDVIRCKGELDPNNLGDVLVVENNARITAIFKNDNGAPKIVMVSKVDVMIEETKATGSSNSTDQAFLRDMQQLSGGSNNSSSSVFAQELNATTLDGVDPATREMLQSIMLEEEEYQKQRRKKALQASNAEIANSTAFGFKSNLMNLTTLGPKIRLRKKIQLPKEWTNPKDHRYCYEIENLFACALFDKNKMMSGLRNVSSSPTTSSVSASTTTATPPGEVKTSSSSTELTFKSGDMLCVHPPLNGGPWWEVENVRIEHILSRTESEMLGRSTRNENSSGSRGSTPRINRNFVQPLVCFYRLRRNIQQKYSKDGLRLVQSSYAETNPEFDKVSALFIAKMGKYAKHCQVTNVDRIQNNDMWEDYHVRHERVDKETHGKPDVRIMHYGCPSMTMVLAIATQGFDWRIHKKNGGIDHKRLGQGFYLDEHGEQAHVEAKPDQNGRCHMILARVCVGRSVKGTPQLRRPPPGFHSASSSGRSGGGGKIVVFDFCQAYPLYKVEYTCNK